MKLHTRRWVWLILVVGVLVAVGLWRLLVVLSFPVDDTVPLDGPRFNSLSTANAAPTLTPTFTSTPTPNLRDLALEQGVLVGASVGGSWLTEDPAYASLAAREYSLITPENAMKFEVVHPEPDRYDFQEADTIVAFALENGLRVRGHTLVWWNQLPKWVTEAYERGTYTREQWKLILHDHIQTVVGRYRGKVYAWDVVNEAITDKGLFTDGIWLNTIGPEYITLAFQWAHEADPQALLFYNDFAAEGLNQKAQAIYVMAQGLLQAGVPVHGVGMQMHIWLGSPPTPDDLATNIRRLGALGLMVQITEMDVRIQYSQASLAERLAAQAQTYRDIFSVCLQAPNCTAFVTWGLTDRYSWIPGYTKQPDAPLLFDESGQPKPAYRAIMDLLQGR